MQAAREESYTPDIANFQVITEPIEGVIKTTRKTPAGKKEGQDGTFVELFRIRPDLVAKALTT